MNYRVYGLNLQSDLLFPQLPAATDGPVDISLTCAAPRPAFEQDRSLTLIESSARQQAEQPWLRVYRGAGVFALSYEQTGDFVIAADGSAITCYPGDRGVNDYLLACLLGAALALSLQLRHTPLLHASAVVIEGQAVAFVDVSTGGKSTLAAAFVGQGAQLLSDDNLPLRLSSGVWVAVPGYPGLRLAAGTITSLLGVSEDLAPVVPGSSKRWVPLAGAFHDQPCPLAAIYMLRAEPATACAPFAHSAPINKRDAAVSLVRHSFGAAWITPTMRASQFATYANLAATVPLRSLSYSRGFANLPTVCDLIREEAQSARQQGLIGTPALGGG